MNIIEKYEKALQDIYHHVGFQEDWVVYPIADMTGSFWAHDNRSIYYSKDETFEDESILYGGEIYKQRFYKKHIYEGAQYTMVFYDSQTDGMKYFAIFENDKYREMPEWL